MIFRARQYRNNDNENTARMITSYTHASRYHVRASHLRTPKETQSHKVYAHLRRNFSLLSHPKQPIIPLAQVLACTAPIATVATSGSAVKWFFTSAARPRNAAFSPSTRPARSRTARWLCSCSADKRFTFCWVHRGVFRCWCGRRYGGKVSFPWQETNWFETPLFAPFTIYSCCAFALYSRDIRAASTPYLLRIHLVLTLYCRCGVVFTPYSLEITSCHTRCPHCSTRCLSVSRFLCPNINVSLGVPPYHSPLVSQSVSQSQPLWHCSSYRMCSSQLGFLTLDYSLNHNQSVSSTG